MSDRTCPGCGVDLTGAHGRRRFCSNPCRTWVRNGHTDLRVVAECCAVCGGPMKGKRANAVYCTRVCKLRASERRRDRDDAARYVREREHRIAYAKAYAAQNPHVGQLSRRNRRAAARGGRVKPADWLKLCRRYGGRCAYCGIKGQLTVDHVVPLVRGGRNTIGNVLPACMSCNCHKQGRFIMEWRLGKSRRRSGGRYALETVRAG